ncbi:MAG: preprotein translocase subunit SecG [Clostridiales bacterium]|nr:preprotein translocase subunit SecG [Clostridiales bacterium]
MELAFGIILLVAAVFLVAAVLMQHGKSHGMSGTISGGAETFFGSGKGRTIDSVLSKVTTIVAIVFCILVIVMFMFQGKITGTSSSKNPTEDETQASQSTESTENTDSSEENADATENSETAE